MRHFFDRAYFLSTSKLYLPNLLQYVAPSVGFQYTQTPNYHVLFQGTNFDSFLFFYNGTSRYKFESLPLALSEPIFKNWPAYSSRFRSDLEFFRKTLFITPAQVFIPGSYVAGNYFTGDFYSNQVSFFIYSNKLFITFRFLIICFFVTFLAIKMFKIGGLLVSRKRCM